MFGFKRKIALTDRKPSCEICIHSQLNDEYELICKGKKEVELDSCCRKYELDITKIAEQRSHAPVKKQFDEDAFKL